MNRITLSARGTRRLQFFAGAWLWLEALLIWIAPALALALAYGSLAIWNFLAMLPALMQITLAVLFWAAAGFLLWREFPHVRWPNLSRVKSRLERAGELQHQPLQTLSDEPMRRSEIANVLWQHHQFSAAHDLAHLRWPKLRAGFAPRDPFALRWLFLLLLFLGALQNAEVLSARLRAAFWPDNLSRVAELGPSAFHLYITPPEYTGMKPAYYSSGMKMPAQLQIPAGSKIWLRVSGGSMKPRLDIGTEEYKLSRTQDHFFSIEQPLPSAQRLKLRQGIFILLDIPVDIIPPRMPMISALAIRNLPRAQVEVKFCAEDQYALRGIAFQWQGTLRPEIKGRYAIPADGKKLCAAEILNVASDPLAGEMVEFRVSAAGAAGLARESEPQKIMLPQYEFRHVWAEKLAAARQDFLLGRADQHALLEVIAALRRTRLPVGLYLALQSIARDLESGRTAGAAADLWPVIMRIEEGEYADIANNWRAQREALLQGLREWHISERNLSARANEAIAAWDAFAPAWGYDGDAFGAVWNHISALIASGNRSAAAQIIRQMDSDPGSVLNIVKLPEADQSAAAALQQIRARLTEPDISAAERDYLERLLRLD